jgi:hypothetical protein
MGIVPYDFDVCFYVNSELKFDPILRSSECTKSRWIVEFLRNLWQMTLDIVVSGIAGCVDPLIRKISWKCWIYQLLFSRSNWRSNITSWKNSLASSTVRVCCRHDARSVFIAWTANSGAVDCEDTGVPVLWVE